MKRAIHHKCRAGHVPFTTVARLIFPDELVPWTTPFNGYNPPEYTAPSLKGKPYADPDLETAGFAPKWNSLDGQVNRVSYEGEYAVANGRPLNPRGRTGLSGRGVLGRWGPNHAADPVVTRWKMADGEKTVDVNTKLPILQFCAIQRRDCGQWAIPGGMVDPGEHVSQTVRREFMEEALSSLESDPAKRKKDEQMVEEFFSAGQAIYKGYVDDPRNTDNAWMETVAFNFHDETGDSVGQFDLKAGDDAKDIKWIDISKDLDLYASHSELIHKVVELRRAHW